jgi:hypothetical protein
MKTFKNVAVVDPPSGWRYGFPKKYNPEPEESLAQWFIKNGYPEEDVELALKHSRYWTAVEILDENNC